MTDSTDDVDWYAGPDEKDDYCECGCVIKIARLAKRVKALEKLLKQAMPRRELLLKEKRDGGPDLSDPQKDNPF